MFISMLLSSVEILIPIKLSIFPHILCIRSVYLLLIFGIFYNFQYDYKFISKHEVTSYRVKLLNTTVSTSGTKTLLQKDYYINCDGEVIRLREPVFDVRLHRKVVTFFGDVAG